MKTIRQLIRQPIKTVLGALLIALAVAALCVGVGQSFAAKETENTLDEIYLSAAFPGALGEEGIQWLNSYAQTHPDVVKQQSRVGIASAYLPGLTLDNWTQYIHKSVMADDWTCAPYNSAMLEISLVSIGEPQPESYFTKLESGVYVGINDTSGALYVELLGVVERVIGLQEGYADPTGYTARLRLQVKNSEELEALDLREGERYIVYGVNYFDRDFAVRNSIAGELGDLQYAGTILPYWDPNRYEVEYDYDHIRVNPETGETVYVYLERDASGAIIETVKDFSEVKIQSIICQLDYVIARLSGQDVKDYRAITMTLVNYGTYPQVRLSWNEEGFPYFEEIEERSYVDENGDTISITREEYAQRYQMPTIAHLTGTAEEFLNSEEGGLWMQALTDIQVNNHAFAFVGVDKLNYLENFNSGEIKIVEGRDFTKAELTSGEKVCIISRQLAEANGLRVGDTINPQFYDPDVSLKYQPVFNSNLPKPMYFYGNTSRLYEAQSYRIVGIYEQNNPHPYVLENPRCFTCNTVFTPKAALNCAMQRGDSYILQTVVISNGKLDEFLQAVTEAGFSDSFVYTDSDYSSVNRSLEAYQRNAKSAMTVGLSVYAIILFLYMLLYPMRQKKNLAVMDALGAGRVRQLGHIYTESLLILLVGTLLGGAAGVLMWDGVVNMLTKDSAFALNIALPGADFAMICAGQLIVAWVLVAMLSYAVIFRKTFRKRH